MLSPILIIGRFIILAIWTIALFPHTSACGTLEYGENKYYRRTGFQCLADQTFITATTCLLYHSSFTANSMNNTSGWVTAFRKAVDDISVIADNSDVGRRSTHTCVDKMKHWNRRLFHMLLQMHWQKLPRNILSLEKQALLL